MAMMQKIGEVLERNRVLGVQLPFLVKILNFISPVIPCNKNKILSSPPLPVVVSFPRRGVSYNLVSIFWVPINFVCVFTPWHELLSLPIPFRRWSFSPLFLFFLLIPNW